MTIRPLVDRIIVKRIEEGEPKIGGIIIPDSAREKPQRGKVIAMESKGVALDVKKGDTILFVKYSGQQIEIDGEEHLLLRPEDVIAEEVEPGVFIAVNSPSAFGSTRPGASGTRK